MKPTVYLPLADLCPTGVRRSSTSSIARFSAGRVSTHRLWIQTEGKQVGAYEQQKETAGDSRKKHSP
jgi:hypothetical protein